MPNFEKSNVQKELNKYRLQRQGQEDSLIKEANRILSADLFSEKKILEHLVQYNSTFELVSEEDVPSNLVFTLQEIKWICISLRLKFLDSKQYANDIPNEAILKIKKFNARFGKELTHFKILSTASSFKKKEDSETLLFAKTYGNNYFLIHQWGNRLKWHRKLRFWYLRSFENLFLTLIGVTLLIDLILPTSLITLDKKAEYFSGYRAATFFHLLIFNTGVTAYAFFAFGKNFSGSIWNRHNEFD